jgi:hypothetical protein
MLGSLSGAHFYVEWLCINRFLAPRKTALRARFDRIFTRMTGFVTLDRLLVRLNSTSQSR